MPVELQLLGKTRVRLGDVDAAFGTERRHRLLAYLALRGQWVRRTELALLFYPDRDAVAARSNLRKLLHDARALAWMERAGLEVADESVRWLVDTDVSQLGLAVREEGAQFSSDLLRLAKVLK